MSVNFYKHRDELVDAWKDVMNEKTKTNWALFGYDKMTNDLVLVGKGDGGLEEIAEEMSCSKILYGYCKVIDPNTELAKYVLINWQGEGAPLQRKGICMNHFRDIQDFFKGAHLTIHARTEEDVEASSIISKITKISARMNVKERLSSDMTENIAPVGSNYKRIQPQREISVTDREKFWNKTQEDEMKRKEEEKNRIRDARTKMELERKEQELKEAKRREEESKERDKQLLKMREAEQNAENAVKKESQKEKWSHGDGIDDDERRRRSESLRKERAEEANSVITHGSIRNARAIFEQNSSSGQMNSHSFRIERPPIQITQQTSNNSNSYSSQSRGKVNVAQSFMQQVQAQKQEEAAPKLAPTQNTTFAAKTNLVSSRITSIEKPIDKPVEKPIEKPSRLAEERKVFQVQKEVVHEKVNAISNLSENPDKNSRAPNVVEKHEYKDEHEHEEIEDEPIVIQKEIKAEIKTFEPKVEPIKIPIPPQQHSPQPEPELTPEPEVIVHEDEPEPEIEPQMVYTKNLLNDVFKVPEPLEDIAEEQNWDEGVKSGGNGYTNGNSEKYDNNGDEDIRLRRARALYDYQAADETEISFDPDDLITHIELIDEGWWQGMAPDGSYGLFPSNYVELIE